ncbi:bacteriocin-like protein [Chryseobacterium sp. CH1]|uniref:bacteriocin-like protein n=1 Tax=Chryseobacterium sp. CH1 TaxID=713551 RepID=UPI003977AA4D
MNNIEIFIILVKHSNPNYMKNLKKLSRQAAKEINGGMKLFRCSETRPCSVGYCCNGECIDHDCMIEP